MQNKLTSKGITLIALVITIIILLILAGVTVVLVLGEDGIIDRAKEAAFKSRMTDIQEKVMLYWTNKEQDSLLIGNNPTVYQKLPIKLIGENGTTVDKAFFSDSLITDIENISSKELVNVNLYEIDKNLIKSDAQHTYLIDIDTLQVYDKEGEKFKGKIFHSLNSLGVEGVGDITIAERASTQEDYTELDGDGWIKPDLTGFGMDYTKIIYYNKDNMNDIIEVPLREYLNGGRQSCFDRNGNKYLFDGYNEKIWANIKVNANSLETWWVWQPRYAYKIEGEGSDPSIDIIFINKRNQPIGSKYSGRYTVNNDDTITIDDDIYRVHPGFTINESDGTKKELQGIWMSKYEPSSTPNSSYTLDSGECFPPNMNGFDSEKTYIELFDITTNSFVEEVKLSEANLKTINNDNRWYDYKNKVWANIKTVANGIETWWVWQPRYAYSITEAEQEMDLLFVDLNDKPYDKEKYGDYIPEGLETHPGFNVKDSNGNIKKLQGIWISKYEPSTINNSDLVSDSGECLKPDLTGFDLTKDGIEQNKTYVIYWSPDFSKTREVLVKDYISGGEQRTITYDNEIYTFYDYKNKIWANIKTTANDYECWWVWQPRYAYSVAAGEQEINVVFVDLNNKPVDTATYGNALKDGMIVHPGFTETWKEDVNGEEVTRTKELQGIWMSKYEPSSRD